MTQHTIILTQSHATRKESRSWEDYQTLHLAVEGVISKFETKLKELNPAVRNIHCK
ncbi:hypothetical protein HDU85_005688 [Gaertneriomyces sp. JEL0708]|nr:hypothetical protein HDU85_005688 [Gaertneriomyces sp. JEL0708]